jgi:hypothetical protein
MLSSVQKKKLEEVVLYYTRTTGKDYAIFVQELMAYQLGTLDTSEYSAWLTSSIIDVLADFDLTIADCLANKDVLQAGVLADKSRGEGEFYTPLIWCAEGRKYLQKFLGDKWGEAVVYDGSCGSGNLMREANYPPDKLFLSTLLAEDVELVKNTFPEAHVFQLDFVNGVDYDENNMYFSEKLPPELRKVLENNEPIVFFMNPPYLVGQGAVSDLGSYMRECSMGACASDIMYQFIFRVLMLIDTYKLTNVTLALYGGIALLHSRHLNDLLKMVEDRLKFMGGMCFRVSEFSNTSRSVDWAVPFVVWQSKTEEEKAAGLRNPIILDAKERHGDSIETVGSREFKPADYPLEAWIEAKDVDSLTMMPQFISLNNSKGVLAKRATNAIATLMSDAYVIRGTRRNMISSASCPDNIDITPENFWRALCSYNIRTCYKRVVNAFDNCQYFSAPDTTVEGFEQWCINGLPLFLFDLSNFSVSYRGWQEAGTSWNISNKLFPIPAERIMQLCNNTGVIAEDYKNCPGDNSFILQVIQYAYPKFSENAKELFDYGVKCIEDSITNGSRERAGYANNLGTWDAGLQQIRRTEGTWSKEQEETLSKLIGKSKRELTHGIYKYGFLKHYCSDYQNLEETNLSDSDIETLDEVEEV